MVNKSLILAFTAVAVAAPFGGPSSSNTGSKIARSEKRADGESIPDGLNYFNPNDDDETDWYDWELEDPDTEGSTVQNKADPEPDTTTVALQVTSQAHYEEYPSTSAHHNTTLQQVQTSAPAYHALTTSTTIREAKVTSPPAYKAVSTTVRNEILPAYSAPAKQNELETYEEPKQNNEVVEPYHSTSTLKNEVAEPYHTTSTLNNQVAEPYPTVSRFQNEAVPEPYQSSSVKPDVQEPYHTTSVVADVQKPYQSTSIQAAVQESYHTTSVVADVQKPYQTTSIQEAVQEPYHTSALKDEVAQPYHSTTVQADVQEPYAATSTLRQEQVQESYPPAPVFNDEAPPQSYRQDSPFRNAPGSYNRRDVQQGYGKAEFEKQSHVPSTTAAAACAAKSPAILGPRLRGERCCRTEHPRQVRRLLSRA